ncbi:MAG: zinc ribbon domain-containing protein [Gemmatimonadetes bacterium]|nr:zinc ribbon domain-containing protein [Gemmatimonadota bacterium]
MNQDTVAQLVAMVLVGFALFWLVAQPLIAPGVETAPILEPIDPEETPRGQALLALKEIEFDRATGKLSDEDYAELHARYSSRALELLDGPSTVVSAPSHADPVEALLTQRIVTQGGFCGSCGARRVPGGRFCGSCGAPQAV